MEHIRTTAKRLIKNLEGRKCPDYNSALTNGLKKILTKQEQRHIRYCTIQNARVTLGVDSSAWLYMFHLKKKQLLKDLNQIFPSKTIIQEILLQLDIDSKYTR